MTAQKRLEPSALLLENPIIAVLRTRDAVDYDAVIDVLVLERTRTAVKAAAGAPA